MSDKNIKNRYEQILKNILEIGGAGLILVIVFGFVFIAFIRLKSYDKNDRSYIDTLHISKIKYFEISKKSLDTSDIALSKELIHNLNERTDSLNSKVKQINKVSSDLRKIQEENIDSFKFYLTIIGFIFAIVGFFGFKSIFDTRQGAIDRAIIESKEAAKIEAKDTAKTEAKIASLTEARTTSQEVAKEVAEKIAQKIAEIEAHKFFSDTFQKLFNEWEQTYKSSIDDQFTEILDDINKLKRPEAYGIIDNDKEKFNKKLKEFEEKQSELLNLIADIKLEFLKK